MYPAGPEPFWFRAGGAWALGVGLDLTSHSPRCFSPLDRLLDCLNRIRWEQDSTLSYRMSCAHGICGSDGMRINGVCGLP